MADNDNTRQKKSIDGSNQMKERTTSHQADELKKRFKAGSIPLETDFAELIDMANAGALATGQADGKSEPGLGLEFDENGKLKVKVGVGMVVDETGVHSNIGMLLNLSSDLIRKSDRMASPSDEDIFAGNGYVSKKPVPSSIGESDADEYTGLWIDSKGRQAVRAGPSIKLESNGVNVKMKPDSGLSVDDEGVSIKLTADSGLSIDDTNGLQVVSQQRFQKGMVMMFAGTMDEIPEGWALCDGNDERPNLIDRFILGSAPEDSKKFNNIVLEDSDDVKVCNKESTPEEVIGTINIEETKLTEDQIPPHAHIGGVAYKEESGFAYSSSLGGTNPYQIDNSIKLKGFKSSSSSDRSLFSSEEDHQPNYANTSTIGKGEGHTHKGRMSTEAHKHTTDVIPPYYTLAFIIKL